MERGLVKLGRPSNAPVSKLCLECGLLFFKKSREENRNIFLKNRKFCGHECSAKARSKMLMGRPTYRGGPSATCIEKARIANTSSSSYRWKGGISKKPGYRTLKSLERQARLKGAVGSFTLQEWEDVKLRYGYRCAHCGTDKAKLTKDHIIALTKGGSNYISNIQPLCQSCNSRKNNKPDIYNNG